jgi:hypothetical protein
MSDICFDVDVALAEVPVNLVPLIDDTDFKSIEASVAYNAAGLALYWHFVTPAGAFSSTAVTPTTGGVYDWAHQGQGIYTIEIPATSGASINNNTEGFGWFTGVATGVLPWRGPVCTFRAAALNDALIEGGDLLDVSVTQINGSAATSSSGRMEVNATHWAGTAMATPDTAGYPKVTLKTGTGTGEVSLSSGAVLIRTSLRNGQALAGFPFLMTDSTNHNPATGKTVSVSRSIDGGAFAATTASTATEVSNGTYKINLSASDMAGTTIMLRMTATGCDDLFTGLVNEPA